MYSTNQMRILGLLFTHPGEEFYLNQIGDIIGKKPGFFQRGINTLEKEGVLVSRRQGNQRVFSINVKYPLIEEIRSIIQKTVGVEALLRDFAYEVDGIRIALIYGSYAKESLRPGSDIDLLLVGSEKSIEDDIINRLDSIERKIQREVNYTLYSIDEFNTRRNTHEPFLDEIMTVPFILLKGTV
jgi:predicted nucleotidyltransferase